MPSTSTFPLSKAYFVALFCEAILHGFFTALAAGAVYILLLSTVHIALSSRQNLIAFFDQHAAEGSLSILNDQGNPIVYVQIAVEVINCLIGDSIVAWRAWVLWVRNYRIIIPPILCIVGGLRIGMVHAFAVSPPGEEVYNDDIITNWFLSFGAFTCISNIYCVVGIAYKAWATFHFLRKHSREVVIHGRKYHSALLVIVESGALYCVVLIITVILFSTDNNGVYVLADILGHLTGIYPTVIIVLVSLKMSFYDDLILAEKTMTTFQAEAASAQSTTLHSRRRARDVHEPEETDSTFVLESLTQRMAPRLNGSTKGVDIV